VTNALTAARWLLVPAECSFGVVLFLAPALGPTIGGLLIPLGGWPLIFLLNVPFGLLGALGVLRLPQPSSEHRHPAAVHFDLLGVLMLAGGLVLAIWGNPGSAAWLDHTRGLALSGEWCRRAGALHHLGP
jgi:hypothetical protein